MNQFAKFIILNIFMLTVPLFLTLLSFKVSGITFNTIKHELQATKTYDTLTALVYDQMDQAAAKYSDNSDYAAAIPLLKQAITPVYIQRKVEMFIDDLEGWVTNKTQIEPSISFSDLKDEVLNLPQYKQQLKQVNNFVKIQKQVKVDPALLPEIPSVNTDIESTLGKNLTFKVGTKFAWMKKMYQYYDLTLILLAVMSILCLVGIISLSKGLKSKLTSTSSTLFVTALLVILPMMLTTNLGDIMAKQIAIQYPAFPPNIINLLQSLLRVLSNTSLLINQIALGSFLFISVVCFIWSRFVKVNTQAQEDKKEPLIDKSSLLDPVSTVAIAPAQNTPTQ